MDIFLISDTHFDHGNIIDYCSRPFADTEEMLEKIVKNWNRVVKKDDIVYHLGDFSLRSTKERATQILSRLNGRKILVKGNHDTKPDQWYRDCGFEIVYRKPVVFEPGVIFSHEPPEEKFIIPEYRYFFGHVHDKMCPADEHTNCFCVCVERLNYTPVSYKTALSMLE